MGNLIQHLQYLTHTNEKLTTYYHDGYEVVYIISGIVDIIIDDTTYHVVAPSVVVFNPFEKYSTINESDDYLRFTLSINAIELQKFIEEDILAMLKFRPTHHNHVTKLSRDATFSINRMFSILSDEISSNFAHRTTIIRNEVHNMLITIYRSANLHIKIPKDDIILQILQYIDKNYNNIEDMQHITNKFNIAQSTLSHTFKDRTGYSPRDYLINTRISNAQLMLKQTDYSVEEIGKILGYNDSNNFIRIFKQKVSIPPLQFRKDSHKMR